MYIIKEEHQTEKVKFDIELTKCENHQASI